MNRTIIAILTLAACGGDDGGTPTGIDISSLTYKACDAATRVGGFEVVLETEFTGTQGQIFDSVLPTSVPQTITTMGACSLVAAPNYQCTPTCPGSQVCNASQTCVPYPAAHSVGDVSIAGLLTGVTMAPRAPTYFYTNPSTLPHPGYEAGAGVKLTVAGGDYAAYSLLGFGVEALVVPSPTITVERNKALALAWTPPVETGPQKLTISLNINGHGLVGSHVECVVDDTGSYTIPADLITQLVDAGTSGFPTVTLTRQSLDSTTLAPGCVDFRVRSSQKLDVTIPGLQSCQDDTDCTPPQTCQGDLTCG